MVYQCRLVTAIVLLADELRAKKHVSCTVVSVSDIRSDIVFNLYFNRNMFVIITSFSWKNIQWIVVSNLCSQHKIMNTANTIIHYNYKIIQLLLLIHNVLFAAKK